MKRIQEEMTKDELAAKQSLLESLEKSEMEASRIENYLASGGHTSPQPRRSTSSASARSIKSEAGTIQRPEGEERASIDSDFPPTHANSPSPSHGAQGQDQTTPTRSKSQSGGFVANKIFGRISHTFQGIVDVDPERTRRDQIGKTKESMDHVSKPI